MARSIGSLTLDLIAKTGSFDQGMDRASRRVRNTANEMEAARRAADRMVAGIAAAAAGFATAAAAMAVSSAKALDATSKMAQQIGTTTESLTGMRFAAQQFANISDQQFDMSMRRMTRRIAEAAEGSGSAKAALEAMGLSAKELARLSPDRQMLAIADAMQKTERQADRLRYTMALFDTEGMALVPALQQGAAAFEANIALARQFGVVVSQEAASAAEEFMTNMNLLTEAQKGFKNQVAESVLPVLAEFTGYLVDIAKNAGDMGERVETALKVVGVAAAATATIITSRLVAAILAKAGAWGAATLAAARLQAQMASLSASIAGTSRVVSASAGLAAGAATALGRAGQLALGVLGGPVGLAAAAAITGAAFLAMGRDSKTAATDVDELTRSMENLNRRQLESAAFNLENELAELGKQAEGHGQILQGLRNDYDALSKAQGVTEGELRNVRQAIREEEEAFESVIAAIAKKSPLLAQITQRLWDLDTATRGATGSTDALNRAMGFSEAGEKYLAQIQGRIKALQDSGDPIKIASRYIAEHTELTEADRVAIMSAAHAEKALIAARDAAAKATKSGTNALNEAKRAAEAFRREQDQGLRAQFQAVSAIHQQAGALEDQVLLFGQSKTALEDLTIARLEEQAAILRGFDGSHETVEAIEREIEARRRLRTAMGSLEAKEAEKASWDAWAREIDQVFQQVGQSLTDQLFDGAKSGRDLIRDLFKNLVLRVAIQPVMGAIQGAVTTQLGGMMGLSNPSHGAGGVMGLAQNASSLYSAVTGGLTSSIASAAAGIGNAVGSSALTSFAAGMKGSTLAAGLAGPTTAGATGAMGLGSMAATALPWIGGGLAIAGIASSIFGDREPTTRREQRTQVEYAGGLFDITKVDDRAPAGADAAARALAEQAVQTANDIFRQVGVDAAIDSFHAIMASSYQGDRDGVASGGMLRLGDELRQFGIANEGNPTIQGFGGWSSAETLPRLAIDVSMSLMEALQAAGVMAHRLDGLDIRGMAEDQVTALATTIQHVVQEIAGFDAVIQQLPFANLRDLSFEARDGLLMLTGGLESFVASEQSYIQNFLTEAERTQLVWDEIGRVLGGVNIAVPETRAEFHAIKTSLDLSTESGREAYAAIMSVQGAFASVTQSADELAASAQRAALSAAESAYSALSRSIAAEKTRLQREAENISSALRNSITAASSTVSELTSLTDRLASTVQRMVGQGLDAGRNREWAQDRIERALSVAKLTGVMPQGEDFEAALQIVAQPSEGLFSSFEDYQADFLKTAHTVSELNEVAGDQLNTEKRALRALEDQLLQHEGWYHAEIERLDGMLEYYRRLIDIETGTYTAVLSIPQAIDRAITAISNLTVVGGTGGLGAAPEGVTDYLASNPDLMAAYLAAGGSAYMPAEQWAQYHWDNYGRHEDRPVGLHSFAVGTNRVPYDMVAQIHEGERIIPAADNRALMQMLNAGADRDNTIRLLQQEIRELRTMLERKLDEGNRNTAGIDRTNRQIVDEGLSVEVTNVVPTVAVTPGT